MELMNKIWEAAKSDKKKIVLPEGDEERTIVAAQNSGRRFSSSNISRK